MLKNIRIVVNENIYLKDPESTKLGKSIISGGIELIEELGYDAFTIKKLANKIGTSEASIYRYFENKHKLLLYYVNWYWAWINYRVSFAMINVKSPDERLAIAITILTETVEKDNRFMHIDETKLNHIIINDASKTFLSANVDEVNKEGVFLSYKELVQKLCDVIKEINPDFKYPHMLITTVIEGAHLQRFFSIHLPRLTDDVEGEDATSNFYVSMVNKAIS